MGSWSPNHIFHPCKILLKRKKDHKCYTIFYFHFKHNALDEFWGKVVTEKFLTNKFNKAIFLRYFPLPSFCHYKVTHFVFYCFQNRTTNFACPKVTKTTQGSSFMFCVVLSQEPQTTSWSNLFSSVTCLHTTTFISFSVFLLEERINWKYERDHRSDMWSVHFQFPSMAQKCCLLKHSNHNLWTTCW